jgi:hypothetical protein
MIHADPSRAFVMQAIRCLVEDELAEWHRAEGGELELRLVTGDVFSVSDAGIQHDRLGTGFARAR